jgi:tetratricopeptide (TPR) repeat protein
MNNKANKLEYKALAYVYNMIYLCLRSEGELNNNSIYVIKETLSDVFDIKNDVNEYFTVCKEQLYDEYKHNKTFVHKDYLNSLTTIEIEDLFFHLFKLAISDKKILLSEYETLKSIASISDYPMDKYEKLTNFFYDNNFIVESTEEHHLFYSYLDVFNLGFEHFDNDDNEKALTCYNLFLTEIIKDKLFFGKLIDQRMYVEINGEDAEIVMLENVYFNRGQCHLNLGDYNAALADFIKAIEINPNIENALLYNNIGLIMFKLGDHTRCIKFFDKALEIDEVGSSESYYNRACAYLSNDCEIQNKNKFFEDINKYLELNPDDLSAQELLCQVEKI